MEKETVERLMDELWEISEKFEKLGGECDNYHKTVDLIREATTWAEDEMEHSLRVGSFLRRKEAEEEYGDYAGKHLREEGFLP